MRPVATKQRLQFHHLVLIGSGVFAALLLVFPMGVLLVRGITTQAWEGMRDTGIQEAIQLSFLTTSISALVTLLVGTPLAYVFARWQFPLKRLFIILVELPLVLPPAVAGLALLITFGRRGALGSTLLLLDVTLPFTTAAVIIAQIFVSFPLYVRSAQVGFQNVPREVELAAQVDGADGFVLWRYITLPLASRSLVAGLTLSWTRSLGEFGATVLFAGSLQGVTQTMPLLIYGAFERNLGGAIWTGLILAGLALGALLISHWLTRSTEDELGLDA